MLKRLVLASNNQGKLLELTAMLERYGIECVLQSDLGVKTVDEPHATFAENALVKARHAALATGLPAIADDSGLCVDALDGAPGVLSARFAGVPSNDVQNNLELLRRMAGVTQRQAHYTCALVALRAADDPEPLIADARWYGEIAEAPRGAGGFGYDPLFFLPKIGMTAAQLDLVHKNRISHRAFALTQLAAKLTGWR